jgi:hypothetical protein
MTLEEFKALKPLEGRRVRISFSDGQEVVARLFDITTDMDDSQHLIYEAVEWSALPHAPNDKGSFYSAGEEVLSVIPTGGPDA